MASRIEDRSKFVAALVASPDVDAASALCRRVLDRLAETRSAAVPRDFVAAQAGELGLGHEASFEGMRIRSVLERGPESAEEWGVFVSLALRRIGTELEQESARARRFVREADLLESLGIDVYGWVEAAMSAIAVRAVLAAMVEQTKDDAAQGRAGRARAYARVEALRSFASESAKDARANVSTLLDATPLASVLGSGSNAAPSLRFAASTLPPPRGGFVGFLRLVTGVAFLAWVGRALLRIAGVRSTTEVRVDSSSFSIDSTTTLGSRVLRTKSERFTRAAFVGAAHEVRFPSVHLLVGALALAIGIVVGGVYVGDGVRSGETYLLLVGASAILLGGALDLVLAVLVPASRGRTVLELVVAPSRVVRLAGVPVSDAQAALDWLRAAP